MSKDTFDIKDEEIIEYMQTILKQEGISVPVYVEDYIEDDMESKYELDGNYPFKVKSIEDFISILKYIKKTRKYYPPILCIAFDPGGYDQSVMYSFNVDSVIYILDVPYRYIVDYLKKSNKKNTRGNKREPQRIYKSVYDELFDEVVE